MYFSPFSVTVCEYDREDNQKLVYGSHCISFNCFYAGLRMGGVEQVCRECFYKHCQYVFVFYGLAMTFELISFLLNSSLLIQKISLKEYERRERKIDFYLSSRHNSKFA